MKFSITTSFSAYEIMHQHNLIQILYPQSGCSTDECKTVSIFFITLTIAGHSVSSTGDIPLFMQDLLDFDKTWRQ